MKTAKKEMQPPPLPKQELHFDFESLEWSNLDLAWVDWLQKKFPHVRVRTEIFNKMPVWLEAHETNTKGGPGKGKKRAWKRFITGWLSRAEAKKERFFRAEEW